MRRKQNSYGTVELFQNHRGKNKGDGPFQNSKRWVIGRL
jgi:hypothetical protein